MKTEPPIQSQEPQERSYRASGSHLLPWVAWGVVILVLVLKGLLPAVASSEPSKGQEAQSAALVDVVMKLQGRMTLAAKQFADMQKSPMPEDQILVLEVGSIRQRQQAAALAGVLFGRQGALDSLDRLKTAASKADHSLSDVQLQTNQAIADAFKGQEDPTADTERKQTLSSTQQAMLSKELGWFGELIIARTQPGEEAAWKSIQINAMTLLFVVIGAMIAIGLLGVLGFIGLILGLVWSFSGRLEALRDSGCPGLYIETFAIWLVVFLILSELFGLIGLGIAGSIIVFFLSLVSLAWLPIRGRSFARSCSEIGLTTGRGLVREIACGVAGFVMMIPILMLGVLGTLIMVKLSELMAPSEPGFESNAGAAHPIFSIFDQATTMQLVAVFITAAVAAPIVEEIAFRGLLYRHLRDGSRGLRTWFSIAMSALVSGFIFAAIHPQGWVAIPALGCLGAAFALAREWRQCLIAPMVMHGLQNGLVLTFVLLLIG